MQRDQIRKRSAILLGLGSVGKKHLQKLLLIFEEIFVIDPDHNAEKYLSTIEQPSKVNYVSELGHLALSGLPELAVIANWGPDHFESFMKLSNIGIKNFIIEKPTTDSFLELDGINNLCKEKKLNLKTNLSLIYSNLPKVLNDLQTDNVLGEPVAIHVYGGAKCVSTIGIHWLALATNLFGVRPNLVTASLETDFINPRNPKLKYLEGTASWSYSDKRYLVVSFINSSHIELKCSIMYKKAVIEIEGQILRLRKISAFNDELLDKPTKTAIPTEIIHLENIFDDVNRRDPLDMIYEEILNSAATPTPDVGLESTSDLLSALLSNDLGVKIQLPLQMDKTSPYFNRKWNIS